MKQNPKKQKIPRTYKMLFLSSFIVIIMQIITLFL